MAAPELYTAAEVAGILRMNLQVIQRKLQAGEIPAYRIGREWRIERAQLMSWLEQRSNQRPRATPDRFFEPDGRLRALPAQRSKREGIYDRIVAAFEPDRTYKETELNAILRRFHDDVATIRRELIATKRLIRTTRGVYKRSTPAAPVLRRA
jgi:excisionase family DNA binding protein